MKNFKKYRIYVFLFTILVFLILVKLLVKPIEIKPQDNTFENITPGQTNQKTLEKTLGKPVKTESINNNEVYYYQTTKPNWADLFYIDNESKKISLIKNFDVKTEETYQFFIDRFGSPDNKLYGPDSQNGFFVFTFLNKGVSILANPNSNSILEVWYFIPTDINQFLLSFGQGLSLNPPNEPNQF